MSGDIEGIGAAVTAGLASAALEPRHGEAAGGHAGERCRNCGTTLIGSHCHRCGQRVDVHRSFAAIGHDLVHAIFHFEGKLWNTLPLLAWRPGDLTRRYIHGERARFISPLSLFLFAVFLTYAVLSFVGSGSGHGLQEMVADQTETSAVRSRLEQEVSTIDTRLARADLSAEQRKLLTDQRHTLMQSAEFLGLLDHDASASADKTGDEGRFERARIETGIAFVDHGIAKAQTNPGLMLYKVQANAYKFAWALIPLSIPFLWLLYPFSRRFHAYDHFVFVTYSISFMLLLFVVVRLLGMTAIGGWVTSLAVLYVPFHMYRQLRGAYRSSRIGSLARMTLLLVFCALAVTLFMSLLLALGAMG
ncbi:DUF3667 domain-containing protein [Sphingopyxis panaciterrulae]|uniref:DUF3667 domain-containing protein n=1 Tax=Sphingopyxis panaciterrulae TaxID=462372 RepID=A0A7W9B795_9SPHN|nr:DUF3667 domain-containing protein [Sphingopyxis panaciterrulae]MBB5707507.1 hypothetical protein [Sphingopyxis panaciterrulae]